MPSIALTDKADSDLASIHEHYTSCRGARFTDDVIAEIFEALEKLELFTGMGRPSQMPDIRELVLSRLPFIAPYRVVGRQIQILRILHERNERSEDW